jgi:CRP/FNR family transcriptional regulator, dissimilatory nitrate respiration regulator
VFSETDISLVHSNALLRGLPEQELFATTVRRSENQLVAAADTVIVAAGALQPGLFLVAHGTVEMIVAPPEGSEKIVEFARSGGHFGEEVLFGKRPLSYAARTITAAAVLRVPEETVAEWLDRSPGFRARLLGTLAVRIDYMQKDVVTFCTKNATARLVCYLVCQFNQAPCTADGTLSLNITVPRNKLASRLGVSDSHLSRAFKELEQHGLIVKQRNGIFIPDVQGLSKYVCPAGCDW